MGGCSAARFDDGDADLSEICESFRASLVSKAALIGGELRGERWDSCDDAMADLSSGWDGRTHTITGAGGAGGILLAGRVIAASFLALFLRLKGP